MSNNNQQEKSVESEIKKPIETQVAEWSATESSLREMVEASKGITVAGHVDGPKKGREAARLEAERPAYQIAAAWARQALATLPAIPTLDMPDDLFIRVERTREDVVNLLTVLAAEMDAEGDVA